MAWGFPGEGGACLGGGAAGWAGRRASACLPSTRSAAPVLSHGALLPPAPAPSFPDSWGLQPRIAVTEGPWQPALVNQLQIPPHYYPEVFDSLHPTEGKAKRAGVSEWVARTGVLWFSGTGAHPKLQNPDAEDLSDL